MTWHTLIAKKRQQKHVLLWAENFPIISVNEFHSISSNTKAVDRLFTEPFNPPFAYNAIMFTHRCTTKQSRKGYVNLVDSHIYMSVMCSVCNPYNKL